jgi:hypothetical protein
VAVSARCTWSGERVVTFADCAVIPTRRSQLADVADGTHRRHVGDEPVIGSVL